MLYVSCVKPVLSLYYILMLFFYYLPVLPQCLPKDGESLELPSLIST